MCKIRYLASCNMPWQSSIVIPTLGVCLMTMSDHLDSFRQLGSSVIGFRLVDFFLKKIIVGVRGVTICDYLAQTCPWDHLARRRKKIYCLIKNDREAVTFVNLIFRNFG